MKRIVHVNKLTLMLCGVKKDQLVVFLITSDCAFDASEFEKETCLVQFSGLEPLFDHV